MALPFYMPSAGTIRPTVPMTQYYQNSAISIPFVQQFQGNPNMYRPPYQQMHDMVPLPAHGYASIPKHYIPSYPTIAQNLYAIQPSMGYNGYTMPTSHMPNMIYTNVAMPPPQEYSPRAEPEHSYLSQLKSVADRVASSDALLIPDSTKISEATAMPQHNTLTDVIVIPDETPAQGSNFTQPALDVQPRREYELPSASDPSLGQQYVFGDAYQPGLGQTYISKIRSIAEGIPFDDPRFHISYPKKPKSAENSTSQLAGTQGEPQAPTESKKRRNPHKAASNDSKAKKPRSSVKSPDKEPLTSNENKKQESCEYDLAYFSKNPRPDWYPRPVATNCEYLYIGPNRTTVPTPEYMTIKWESFEQSTRSLVELIFKNGSEATHNLDGEYRLEPNKVQDIVTHVAEKCSVNEESVRSALFMMMAP